MNIYRILATNKFAIFFRKIGQSLGINQFITRFFFDRNNEAVFRRMVMQRITDNDNCWDIGAFDGSFTKEVFGEVSTVVCFEPDPVSFDILIRRYRNDPNVRCFNIGLGADDEIVGFDQLSHSGLAISRLASCSQRFVEEEALGNFARVNRADSFLIREGLEIPSVVKIDVEGWEFDVLKGFGEMIHDPKLRMICLEIHLTLLEERGKLGDIKEIGRLLAGARFTLIWTDFSHMIAYRNG